MNYWKVNFPSKTLFFYFIDALNFISNSEAAKGSKPLGPGKNQDDQLNEIFDKLVN